MLEYQQKGLTLKQAKKKLKEYNVDSKIIGDENAYFEKIDSIDNARKCDAVILREKTDKEKTEQLIKKVISKKASVVITTSNLSKYI